MTRFNVNGISTRYFRLPQKKGVKRRLKPSRGNGSMGGVPSQERTLSIPTITYDHIDDSGEKKDVPFFLQEEPPGTVDGKALFLLPISSERRADGSSFLFFKQDLTLTS